MAFDTALFVQQPVDENLLCQVCQNVLEKPTTACVHGHTFCGACLEQWQQQRDNCPSCRADLLETPCLNSIAQGVIIAMQVRCPNKDDDDVTCNKKESIDKNDVVTANDNSHNAKHAGDADGRQDAEKKGNMILQRKTNLPINVLVLKTNLNLHISVAGKESSRNIQNIPKANASWRERTVQCVELEFA